jgi:tRNA G18 (ribose-2'-O)-methylase SpoU
MSLGPTVVEVDDPDDPRLCELTGLTDAEARASVEAEHGCFVVEGLLSLEAAVRAPHPLRSVLVSEPKLQRVLPVLDGVDVDVYVGRPALLEAVTGFAIHRGVVASAGRLPLPDPDALLVDARRVVVVEGLNDHENLGALFRNAAAFGIDAVLLDPATADPLYRRSVRVSLGHVLAVPWTRVESLPAGLEPVRRAGFTTVALTPSGDVDVRSVAEDERLAWLLGAEGPGLTDATTAAADHRARIEMAPGVDSLNVATAAAVAFALSASSR